ncbi:MAG: hypothetical protein J6V01_02835 [Clostridia bacterium]|nr:hypothetical protein [Clostridia bacterium]
MKPVKQKRNIRCAESERAGVDYIRGGAPASADAPRKKAVVRMVALLAVFLAVVAVYSVALLVIPAAEDEQQSPGAGKTYENVYTVYAVRGEIYDRNGKPLVVNEYEKSLVFDYGRMAPTYAAENRDILDCMELLDLFGRSEEFETYYYPLIGSYPSYSYDSVLLGRDSILAVKKRICRELETKEDADARELVAAICKKYSLTDKKGNPLYTDSEMTDLIRIRYEMEAERFAPDQPLTVIIGLSDEEITAIEERGIRGLDVRTTTRRIYCYPGYASHILGRVGRIFAEDAEYYAKLGYPANAIVGIDGCEKAFEEILRGLDGKIKVITDEEGREVSREVIREPENGRDIRLTLDIDLQIAAETALENNIKRISENAKEKQLVNEGEECDCGSIVVQTVTGGQILAAASYPTFDLSTFGEDYATLIETPANPLFNRAFDGAYAVGSTFKVCVAAGALIDGTKMANGQPFTASTLITTKGRYTYYDDYQPECWVYSYNHANHGTINVTRAIQVSCNCFFYEVGRLMGNDRICDWCRSFGLGQRTGIEIGENPGILSDSDYILNNGITWTGGSTLATAIGHGYNRFTPVQLAGYLATVLNGGKRYSAHLLLEDREFGSESGNICDPGIVCEVNIPDDIRSVLINAMSKVVDENDSVTAFDGFAIRTGGKTGTAKITGQSDNGIFIGFAPLDAPVISVACVLEKSSHGYNAAFPVRDVMEKYFEGTH